MEETGSVNANSAPPAAPPLRVLVVDDEKNIRTTLAICLEGMGESVVQAANGRSALEAAARETFHLAFVDLRLGSDSGLDLIPALLAENSSLEIVVVTAFSTVDTAVEAMRRGATDYLAKPFTPAQIRPLVERARERQKTTRRLTYLEQRLAEVAPDNDLTTRSPEMRRVLEIMSRAATSEASVLLLGESGTGKGVLARAIHGLSPRKDHPFVTVNCPTLSGDLLTSELFGHARGAFTGATRDQAGRVEMAEGGTLFLDEIAELSPGLQAKLLRFIQEKQFERLGENRTRTAHVRVLAATHRDLEAEVAAGRFREDLLYRLNVISVRLPALRERPEDIVPLARGFLSFFAQQSRRPPVELSPAAEQALLSHAWPGNVRELRNLMERAVILWPSSVMEPEAFGLKLAAALPSANAPAETSLTLEELERRHIEKVVQESSGLDEAARVLGIDVSTLYRKRKRYQP